METVSVSDPRMVFKYQKHYLLIELSLLLIFSIIQIISWLPSLYTKFAYGLIIPSALKAAFFLTCTAIFFCTLVLFIIKEIRKTEIIITDERFIIKSPYKIRMVLFSEIVSIKFIRLPLHHGFLKIKSNNNSMLIPLYIENMEGMVQAIATGLVRYGSLDVFDKKTIANLTIAAKIYKCEYHRATNALLPILIASGCMFFFNLIVGIQYWGIEMIELLFWSCSGIIVPPFIYICSNFIVNDNQKKEITNRKSPITPKTTFFTVTLIVTLGYFIFGWLYKSIIG